LNAANPTTLAATPVSTCSGWTFIGICLPIWAWVLIYTALLISLIFLIFALVACCSRRRAASQPHKYVPNYPSDFDATKPNAADEVKCKICEKTQHQKDSKHVDANIMQQGGMARPQANGYQQV